jgi:hypothetical protein
MVVGQMSGQCVNPKNSSVHCPSRASGVNGSPRCVTRAKSPTSRGGSIRYRPLAFSSLADISRGIPTRWTKLASTTAMKVRP